MKKPALAAILLLAAVRLAHAQDACPPHASAYATTTDGDTTTVHCQCDPGYFIGGDGCIAAAVPARPALPSLAASTQTVGASLDITGVSYVPEGSAARYLERARAVLGDFLLGKLKSAALKGSVLGVEVSTPMGYFIAIEINVKQSIPWVTSQISAAAAGNLTTEQAGNLPIEFANRIFDVGSPANAVIAKGVVGAGLDAAQDQITESAMGGVASLASSVLPASDEAKASIAESAPKLAGNLRALVQAWSKTAPDQEQEP
jgi:hypothetical protein